MPAALIPLISVIVGAADVGTSVYEGVKSSDQNSADQAANKAQLAQEQQAQANQANLSKQEAVLGAQGQTQAQTGGSLTDSGTAALTDLLAGYPGFQSGTSGTSSSGTSGGGTSSAIAPTTLSAGTSGGSGAVGNSGTPDIAAILAALRSASGGGLGSGGSNLSGGNWQTPSAQAQSWQELSNPVL
jgi:hypothetical protein